MSSARCELTFRFGLRPRNLVRALVGVGCLSVSLAVSAGGDPSGRTLGATAVRWILCVASLSLLALLDWDVRKCHPGIRSLFRGYSYPALAGSLLASTASLGLCMGLDPARNLAAALAGLVLTLISAMLLEGLLRDVRPNGPTLREGAAMARLAALEGIAQRSAWAGGGHGDGVHPPGSPIAHAHASVVSTP